MTERPILFSAPMVRAILAGTKTQTRRLVKLPRTASPHAEFHHCGPVGEAIFTDGSVVYCPFGKPGDRLWGREAFSGAYYNEGPPGDWITDSPIWYWADGNPQYGDWTRPRPSIHMPRWASRITLEVTGVRVERLQDISEADAIAEGMRSNHDTLAETGFSSCVDAFRSTWDHINGPGSSDLNSWVWVVEFKTLKEQQT